MRPRSNRALDLAAVKRIAEREEKRQKKANRIDFFDPEALTAIANAVEQRDERVTLHDREFKLDYQRSTQAVFVDPVDGFIPCGYFNYQRLGGYVTGT